MRMKTCFTTLLLVLTLLHTADASPTGASACPGGVAAVGGAHLTGNEETGEIADYEGLLQLVLDGETILDTTTPANFTLGVDHTLELRRSQSPFFFKGFLFRLGNSEGDEADIDTTMALSLDSEAKDKEAAVQVATTTCVNQENVGGLTHMDNTDKTSVHGILRVDEAAANLPLDVTVVIINSGMSHEHRATDAHTHSGGTSAYYYSRYRLNAVEPAEEPETGEAIPSSANHGPVSSLWLLLFSLCTWAVAL